MPNTAYASNSSAVTDLKLDLLSIIEDMFMVLTAKEKEVVVKRFSLNGQPRQTLEKIGQDFNVTRERVRQIEKIALGKLKRTVTNTKLQVINELAREILESGGGLMLETDLISLILQRIYSSSKVDSHIIRLSLSIDSKLEYMERTNLFYPFWRMQDVSFDDVQKTVDSAFEILETETDIVAIPDIVNRIEATVRLKSKTEPGRLIRSTLKVDKRLKEVDSSIGLVSWRHINPKSIRDKAYIILKKSARPLHFIEIANKISEVGFDRKMVTTQAVHNELIRHDQFVLVGRGLYALKEWGFQEGTVADIIESLLRKKSPLSKQQIIKGVLKQRQVKKGTISLNLQKNDHFVRVGRAMYSLADGRKK